MVLLGREVCHSKLSMFLLSLHVFSVCQVLLPGESFPRMTKGAKGPKESEDTDAAAAAPEVEQSTPVDDTDPRLGNVYFHL